MNTKPHTVWICPAPIDYLPRQTTLRVTGEVLIGNDPNTLIGKALEQVRANGPCTQGSLRKNFPTHHANALKHALHRLQEAGRIVRHGVGRFATWEAL